MMTWFDAHSDIWDDVTNRRAAGETDVLRRHHLPLLNEGGVEGSIFVMWVDSLQEKDHGGKFRQILAAVKDELAETTAVVPVRNYGEMMAAREAGKFYVFLGLEGLCGIEENVEMIDELHAFGCRHASLTWNEENALATGALGDPGRGLTALGREAVRKLEKNRMIVDVSHANDKTFWDVMELSSAPLMASHSNSRALCNAARNLTDDQLRAIRDNGGVVGLNSYQFFISEQAEQQTAEQLTRHLAHMIEVCGIDHIGCGFDFIDFLPGTTNDQFYQDGFPIGTKGLENCTKLPHFHRCLQELGLSDAEIRKIAYGNFHDLIRRTVG